MKVLVAGFQHETNTFAPSEAGWVAFTRGDFFPRYTRGEEMLALHRHSGLPMRGFLEAAEENGWDVAPSCWAGASPSGPMSNDAFSRIRDAIVKDVRQAMAKSAIDAVYLDLHGAAVSQDSVAPEVDLLRELRLLVGEDFPIVASVDLHANVSEDLLSRLDFVTAYRTYPHVDMVETGRRAAALLRVRAAAGARSAVSFKRIPFLIPILSQSDASDPGNSAYELVGQLDRKMGCAPSFTPGFPAADVPQCGPTVWAYGAQGEEAVDILYDFIVSGRQAWSVALLEAPNAAERAIELSENSTGPVLIADPQDNPGAGTNSSTTGLLWALLRAGAGNRWPGQVAMGLINDSVFAERAAKIGAGGSFTASVGQADLDWLGFRTDPPVPGNFLVRSVHAGDVALAGPMMNGTRVDPGVSACVQIDGILLCVSSAPTQMLDRALFRMLEVEPASMKIIALKSAVHFRADFTAIAAHILVARSAGQMAADPAAFPWKKLRPGVDPRC